MNDSNVFDKKFDAGKNRSGDTDAKRILRFRAVLAEILRYVLPEAKGMTPMEIYNLIPPEIEGDNNCATARLEQSEDKAPPAATISFDIMFNSKPLNICIDIEPQGDPDPGYSIIKRGIYYLARMISRQVHKVNKGKGYDGIKKCYSIWIVFDSKHRTKVEPGIIKFKTQCYDSTLPEEKIEKLSQDADLQELIMAYVSDESEDEAVKFLSDLFLCRDEKRILNGFKEYPPDSLLVEEVRNMCDLSILWKNEGIAKGMEKGIEEITLNMINVLRRNKTPENKIKELIIASANISPEKYEEFSARADKQN